MFEQNQKLLVIDGNSILNRAFYATQNQHLTSADGTPTNALFGFLNILLKELEEVKPHYLCVAFDLKAPTFRHLKYTAYKAQRKGMPEELAVQMPLIKDILDAMRVTRVEIEGFEADDVIGAVSLLAEKQGLDAIILTGDKDAFQLVSNLTTVRLPKTSAGRTELEIYDVAAVRDKYGVEPMQMLDVKGLMGDASDNIPGVAGVGEKTALDLIQKHINLEGVYENLDSITKPALKLKLETDKDLAFLSRELATICREVPGVSDLEGYEVEEYDHEKLYEIFMRLGLKSLINRMKVSGGDGPQSEAQGSRPAVQYSKPEVTELQAPQEIKSMCEKIREAGQVSIYAAVNRDSYGTRLDSVGFHTKTTAWQINCNELMFPEQSVFEEIKGLMVDSSIKKFGFEIKQFCVWLMDKGAEMQGLSGDMLIAAYVIDPSLGTRGIEEIAEAKIGMSAARIGKSDAEKASVVSKSIEIMHEIIIENGQKELYFEVELPLIGVLASMEHEGFKVDRERLVEFGKTLGIRITEIEKSIYELAGREFNINSPKQMGVVLFDELKLPIVKKTKTGYSTDVEVLEQLSGEHEIVKWILEYRSLAKLKSTYADGLLSVINPADGRIHTTFKQTVASTGRLSSTEPNLQNIPIRLDMGREIRKVFVAGGEDRFIIDADYSQIELRVLAHIANDTTMCKAFNNNEDIHTTTATQIFGVPANEVTRLMRNRAKTVNFSIVYGISDYSLSRDLGITRAEAKRYIEEYLEHFSGVREYMKTSVELAKKRGYIETLMKRRRYVPELKSSNFNMRSFGERVAMNAPIQGSAADIMKVAMVKVFETLKAKNMKSKLILQVHDEILVESPNDEVEAAAKIVDECMEGAAKLCVPLSAEAKWAYSWYDTK